MKLLVRYQKKQKNNLIVANNTENYFKYYLIIKLNSQ